MAFNTLDEIKILRHLELTVSQRPNVQNQLGYIYGVYGEAIVNEVRGILDDLDDLDRLASEYAVDTNAGIKRADVIEWFDNPQAKTVNLSARVSQLKKRLATTLNLPYKRNCGGTPIHRS